MCEFVFCFLELMLLSRQVCKVSTRRLECLRNTFCRRKSSSCSVTLLQRQTRYESDIVDTDSARSSLIRFGVRSSECIGWNKSGVRQLSTSSRTSLENRASRRRDNLTRLWCTVSDKGRGTSSSMSSHTLATKTFFLDSFALRQWKLDYVGTCMASTDKLQLLQRLESKFQESVSAGESCLAEGYASFCKHIFIENEDPTIYPGAIAITDDNKTELKSGYLARTEKELPVLSRWFEKAREEKEEGEQSKMMPAKYLDVILYSREQVMKEKAAMSAGDDECLPPESVPWCVISIKAQDEDYEIPMQPITMCVVFVTNLSLFLTRHVIPFCF